MVSLLLRQHGRIDRSTIISARLGKTGSALCGTRVMCFDLYLYRRGIVKAHRTEQYHVGEVKGRPDTDVFI